MILAVIALFVVVALMIVASMQQIHEVRDAKLGASKGLTDEEMHVWMNSHKVTLVQTGDDVLLVFRKHGVPIYMVKVGNKWKAY